MSSNISKEQALKELKISDPNTRQNALLILDEFSSRDVTEALLKVLPQIDTSQSGEGYTVAQIINQLMIRKETRCIPIILEILKRDLDNGDDHQIQEMAFEAFQELNAVEALPFLREALFVKEWNDFEEEIANSIASIGGKKEEELLISGLSSKRKTLKLAILKALKKVGTPKALPAIEKITQSSTPDLRLSALLTLATIVPEKAGIYLENAISTAADYSMRSQLIRAVKQITVPEVSQLLLRLSDQDKEWQTLRFEILTVLVEQKYEGIGEVLKKQFQLKSKSPWLKVRTGALLLQHHYDSSLAGELIFTLINKPFDPQRDNFSEANLAGELVLETLATHTSQDPLRFLESVLLFDALRREKLTVYPQGKWKSSQLVKRIVGSEYYEAYDQWILNFRKQHQLTEKVLPNELGGQSGSSSKKSWWKIW